MASIAILNQNYDGFITIENAIDVWGDFIDGLVDFGFGDFKYF
jgi:hypothetical protein